MKRRNTIKLVMLLVLGGGLIVAQAKERVVTKVTMMYKGENPQGYIVLHPVRPVVLGVVPETPASGKGLLPNEALICDWISTERDGKGIIKLKCGGGREFMVVAVGYSDVKGDK